MIAHPNAQAIASVRATQDRMASAVTVKCQWCHHTIEHGPAEALISHGICDNYRCQRLSTEPYGIVTVISLAGESRLAFAQYVNATGDDVTWAHELYLRAEVRFRNALEQLLKDREAGR